MTVDAPTRAVRTLGVVLLTACGGGGSDGGGGGVTPPPPPAATPVATISPAAATLVLGRSEQFAASARDNTGATVPADRITWSSSDERVARVSASGLVTVVGPGAPATITASGGGAQATAAVTPTGLAFRQVTVGSVHVCGITTAGAAYCWGQASEGELGDGVTRDFSPVPVAVHGGLTFTAIEAGGSFTCGLTADGSAHCWGNGPYGQLGNATGRGTEPSTVDGGLHFTAITGGANHACGLVASGAAYCWGRSDLGQLGDGATAPVGRTTPVLVAGGLSFASISAGAGDHTCGITTAGVAYCWGAGSNGELGNGATANSAVPVRVAGGLTFRAISVGGPITCALTMAGAPYCWGYGGNGALGDGTFDDHAVPIAVATSVSFESIDAGGLTVCALTAAGVTHCWGDTRSGVVPPGPLSTASSLAFASISDGGDVTCARTALGVVYCWGLNSVGGLGDGTREDRTTPLSVTTP